MGKSDKHTVDAEGFRVGKAKERNDVCYDIPLSDHIERLVGNDRQAWEMILATQEEWAVRPPPSGTSEVVYVDIPDGSVFQEHPAFGRNSRLNKPGEPIQLGYVACRTTR